MRQQLVKMATAERNRLKRASQKMKPRIRQRFAWLQAEIVSLAIETTKLKREEWGYRERLLRSVPGVGPVF